MVDGINLHPFDKQNPEPQKDVKGKDATASSKTSGGSSSAVVPVDLGPPAPEPNSGSEETEKKDQREPKSGVQDADDMGKFSFGEKTELKPGEERVTDFPDDPTRQLVIKMDEELKSPVFQIREKETGKLIRQIPSEELRELSKRIPDLIKGLMVNNLG